MKSRPRTISNISVGLFILGLLFASCYTRTEGCLDSNATNFDVYADDTCCCTYPSLQVNIIKLVNGESYSVTDTFTNALGQRYQIIEQGFFISNLALSYADGSESMIVETLIRDIPASSGNEVVIEDNFGLIRQSSIAYNVGSIPQNGEITSVKFQVGLTDEIDMLIPDQMPRSHPLGNDNAEDHFIEDDGYVFVRWMIKVIEPASIDLISMNISGEAFPIDVVLSTNQTVVPGVGTRITLEVDYAKWLEGIDFADDVSVIESQIKTNTPGAFSLQ